MPTQAHVLGPQAVPGNQRRTWSDEHRSIANTNTSLEAAGASMQAVCGATGLVKRTELDLCRFKWQAARPRVLWQAVRQPSIMAGIETESIMAGPSTRL
jgi:hypothetical protein